MAFREHSVGPYPDRPCTDRRACQAHSQGEVTWLYHPDDYPAALLHAIVMRGRAAATNVDYADTYRRPSPVLHLVATQTTCVCWLTETGSLLRGRRRLSARTAGGS